MSSFKRFSCPLSWISNKVRRKVSSTLSPETLALNDALVDAVYLKHLISEIYHGNVRESKIPILAYIDFDESLRSTKQVIHSLLLIEKPNVLWHSTPYQVNFPMKHH